MALAMPGSHFSTFYSDRYLTTLRVKQMHDKLCGIPYEHIMILANTGTYGGGFCPVCVRAISRLIEFYTEQN